MKYYAVTDDINELYHYGVKGMKWGQHLFGKEKSPGYKRAASKLRSLAKSTRNDVETRADRKYKKQVEKALKRTILSQQKYGWDQVADNVKANQRAYRDAQKSISRAAKDNRIQQKYNLRVFKTEEKQAAKAAKAEKKFDRYLQDAREGRLRAGNLSNEQIQRINDRLNAERQTRQLGGSEKASYRTRRREAIREGKIEGYKRGTAAGMEELAKGLVQFGLKSRFIKSANNRSEARRQKVRNKIINKKTFRERKAAIRDRIKDDAYESKLMDPEYFNKHLIRISPTKKAAERVMLDKQRKEREMLYSEWLKPKKGENVQAYQERITKQGDAMYDAIQNNRQLKSTYKRKKLRDVGDSGSKKARSAVNKAKAAVNILKTELENYGTYDDYATDKKRGTESKTITTVKDRMPIRTSAPNNYFNFTSGFNDTNAKPPELTKEQKTKYQHRHKTNSKNNSTKTNPSLRGYASTMSNNKPDDISNKYGSYESLFDDITSNSLKEDKKRKKSGGR